MEIISEAKLNTKKRNKLPNSEFGLPDERKFPLNDEAHVLKAIQYFKHCERSKRSQLALNINKKIKEYKMDVTVSKSNPFSKYTSDKYVTIQESYYEDPYVEESVRDNMSFIKKFTVSSWRDMMKLESYCKLVIDESLEKILVGHDTDTIYQINDYLYETYRDFADLNENTSYMYKLVELSKASVMENITDISAFHSSMESFIRILNDYENHPHAYRVCAEMCAKLIPYTSVSENYSDVVHSAMDQLKDLKSSIKNTYDTTYSITPESIDNPTELPETDLSSYTNILREYHDEINSSIRLLEESIDAMIPSNDKVINHYGEVSKKRIHNICEQLHVDFPIENILFAMKYCTKGKVIDKVYESNGIWYGLNENTNTEYIITFLQENDMVLLENNYDLNSYVTCETSVYEKPNARFVRIRNQNSTLSFNEDINKVISEAFAGNISEDGDIKITISPKNSYMDSYSSNHKLLVANYKNRNFEAMKKNIAYVFALISIIERSELYKKRDPDVMKARAFAINDFKTYLKLIQKEQPDFDFVEYYNASDYDKTIVNIPKSTIIGIKKLMRTILL